MNAVSSSATRAVARRDLSAIAVWFAAVRLAKVL